MAKCLKCLEKAVILNPEYCKEHFIEYFENTVFDTIKRFKLLKPHDKVVVACSGGKDSTVVLYLLKKFHGDVTALAINEGISGYRDSTLVDLEKFCSENNVELRVESFENRVGKSLDKLLLKNDHPCSICGTFRRQLLNVHSKGYDKLATGHNMDDEAQAVLMNLFKGNTELLGNSTPISRPVKGFVQKIKPLYFVTEKQVAAYAILKGFDVGFTECPYMKESFRNQVRDILNDYELKHPGTKRNILEKHLSFNYSKKKKYVFCKECGEPSGDVLCKACKIKNERLCTA